MMEETEDLIIDYFFYEGNLYKTTVEDGKVVRTFQFVEWRWKEIGSMLPWAGAQLITPERAHLYQMALLSDAEVQGNA
jgi:hypothetical protein